MNYVKIANSQENLEQNSVDDNERSNHKLLNLPKDSIVSIMK